MIDVTCIWKINALLGEGPVTSIAPRRDGEFIVTSRQQFALRDGVSNTLLYMEKVEPELPDNRFNDGKVDARGHYWAGTMGEQNRNR